MCVWARPLTMARNTSAGQTNYFRSFGTNNLACTASTANWSMGSGPNLQRLNGSDEPIRCNHFSFSPLEHSVTVEFCWSTLEVFYWKFFTGGVLLEISATRDFRCAALLSPHHLRKIGYFHHYSFPQTSYCLPKRSIRCPLPSWPFSIFPPLIRRHSRPLGSASGTAATAARRMERYKLGPIMRSGRWKK